MNKIVLKIKKALKNPSLIIHYILSRKYIAKCIPDKLFLKLKYRLTLKKKLDLKNPKTFNEKLQWLKLYDRNPEHTMMVDKYKVRQYVSDVLGDEYLIPLLGVWDNPDDIDFDSLPEQFVLKCNHNSGLGMCICRDKGALDISLAKKQLRKGLKEDYFIFSREWPYKNVERKIIAEEYMTENAGGELKDFKFMCFNGKVECIFVCTDRFSDDGLKITVFDKNWDIMPFKRKHPVSSVKITKPHNFNKMIEFAEIFSKNHLFMRVDFYEINGKLYFGEITFFPGGGFEKFYPEIWDYKLGNLIKLDLWNINGRDEILKK